jgi:hypothetical protein
MKIRKPLLPPLNQQKSGPVQRKAPAAPNVYRPQPVPKVLQTKTRTNPAPGQTPRIAPPTTRAKAISNGVQFKASTSRVVQAVKFFPNLHPGATEPVNPGSLFRLNSFSDQYRLHRVNSHGVNVPNQQYNFVRTREGDTLLHNRYRHPSIAEGKQVLYAGEVFFNNGKLEWWSNGSGHYQPGADDAGQANLPLENFYSYQQIIKGEHTRKKGKR